MDVNIIPTRSSMSVSNHNSRTCSRTTISDILCTTSTQRELHVKEPRARSKDAEAHASFFYEKPRTLGQFYAIDDPTPMQKLRRNEVNVKRNLEFKKERDKFFARLKDEKNFQLFLENESATKIQATFRGFKMRPKPETFDKTMYRRYEHLPASVSEINAELCSWQSILQLKPIPGLTLESAGRNAKRQAKFEYAAAIRIQCFFRMISATLRVTIKRRKREAMRKLEASLTLSKFLHYCLKRVRHHRQSDRHKHLAATLIQSAFRIFSARSWVRRVNRMKRSTIRRNDAATRIQRTFMAKLQIIKELRMIQEEKKLSEEDNEGEEEQEVVEDDATYA